MQLLSPLASTSSLSPPPPTARPSSTRKTRPCNCCKFRKVVCKRTREKLDACDWCLDRGLQCVTDTTPYTRKGRRIEAAKSKFGTASSSTTIKRTETAMATREMDSSLAYHLVEIYVEGGYSQRDSPHFILPLTSWALFKQQFENAGRDPSNLSGAFEVMSYIVFANAARVSQHSAVTGLITNGQANPASRDNAYRALIQKAVQLCDEKGIWRSNVEGAEVGMTVMLLMHYLVCDGELGSKEAKHYSKSAFDLFRLLWAEAPEERRAKVGEFDGFAWVSLILDAYSSAETGAAPLMTDLDITTYIGPFPAFLLTPSTSTFNIVPTASGAGQKFWQPWLGAIKFVVDLARATGSWKRGMGGMESVMGIWKGIEEVIEWAKYATKAREGLEKHFRNFCELYTGLIWACCADLCSIIRDHLNILLSTSDPTIGDGEGLVEWITLSALAKQRARETITELIHDTKNDRKTYILAVRIEVGNHGERLLESFGE